jgi:hypothetical protein
VAWLGPLAFLVTPGPCEWAPPVTRDVDQFEQIAADGGGRYADDPSYGPAMPSQIIAKPFAVLS